MKPALIYYVAASLDGYIARPDGRVDWLRPIEDAGEDYGYHDFYSGIDALLMGRVTYETILKYADKWPYPGKTCIVLTRSVLPAADSDVHICHWTPSEALNKLGDMGCKRVWLVGGGSLAGTCYSAGLLDELVVSVVPHMLGAGIKMFATGLERGLTLQTQRNFSTGVVQLHYQVQGEAA
ncbi:dihydrofolate reductase family protein [Zestomonas carbonaria]|uniref:IS1595 family transposase ISCac2 n=1 Tax=Zestomonas carbonaria TaxID=2762745 RepID=A0A7U7EQ64_9GAMM|nr:dihydrofolate reductase family protein [Pseudomonas carbonaria]CAD5108733.1 IS1595 family transposase ISCac2 [Pseudomonas carbonaria]